MIMNQPVGVRLFPDAHRLADARHLNAAVEYGRPTPGDAKTCGLSAGLIEVHSLSGNAGNCQAIAASA